MKPLPLKEIYAKVATVADGELATTALLSGREIGHFNVFSVEDLMRGYAHKPPMSFDRRAYYKISLMRGQSRLEYADQTISINQQALWFTNLQVPYRWLPQHQEQRGYFCIFTEDFLLPVKGEFGITQLPIFQAGANPILAINDQQYRDIEALFEKMTGEMASLYPYKYDLLRAYLWELVHLGQKLQPTAVSPPAHQSLARLAARFTELLERQFPLATPQQQLRLRTAKDYAEHLAVHVNHLNRVLKETTGHTTTALISRRITQEAKILLKQTNWTVSEIADCLGFTDVAHFCHFVKRQTGLVPSAFRNKQMV
ncbi:AraC family transcriptional regulator [Spirosoma sp. 209]|uniref:helix-turn-helix domain-containing protein n=1 Tax=Spirosoma sp. 209 TaxID=1955701 RepID=UPI00098D63B2|nr:AraC family transcriptional regulator [Spirosoma sp. 209]